MRVPTLASLALLGAVCPVAAHQHHHEHTEGPFDPLRAPEFGEDSVEELERKWSFEVSWIRILFMKREMGETSSDLLKVGGGTSYLSQFKIPHAI